MANLIGWRERVGILKNEAPKSPWGSGGGSGGGGNGNGGSGGNGPRNPWSFPPDGKRPRPGASTLDELLKRARGGGGSGMPGVPTGPRLWALIALGLVALWVLFTSFHQIGPQERGVVTFLGRYTGTMGPGVQVTLPAPFMSVHKINVDAMRIESFPQGGGGENLMLTGDQNIVDLKFQVRWNVINPEQYMFQLTAPQDTVRATAESAMRMVLANSTLDQALGSGRGAIAVKVQNLTQQILDRYRSGIRINGVEIKEAGPPNRIEEDFKQVTAAKQEAQANINRANAYAQQLIAGAQGETARFDKLYEQYKLAPEVTKRRMYYDTMEKVLAKSNKVIVETPGVAPYLALPPLARRTDAQQPDAQPTATASPSPQAQTQPSGGTR